MIIASIDLMKGKAVQLIEGKEKVLERDNPLELAREFDRYGEIALIDLDAAMGKVAAGENPQLIREICGIADCRVGGGIRTAAQARELVSWGARKVIIGTKAFENNRVNIPFLEELAKSIGKERIMAAIDARRQEIVTNAWQQPTGLPLLETAKALEPYVSGFLFTCVEREGKKQGTDIAAIEKLRQTLHQGRPANL